MTHGILPDTMLTVTLVPVIKDKAGKIGSLDNNRPIALASILSNVLEKFIYTTENLFGFESGQISIISVETLVWV